MRTHRYSINAVLGGRAARRYGRRRVGRVYTVEVARLSGLVIASDKRAGAIIAVVGSGCCPDIWIRTPIVGERTIEAGRRRVQIQSHFDTRHATKLKVL